MDEFPRQAPQLPGFAIGPGGEPPKRAHLYVGNLSPRVTEYMLQEIFAVAGPVLGVKIIPDRNFQHGGANYGFVEYHELRSAETALQTLNGRKIFDLEIKCNWANQNTQQNKEDLTHHTHLFVGDLSPEVTDDVLQKCFIAFGSLSDARVMWDMNSGKSRGYGFLAYRDRNDAEQAVQSMNGEWLGSRAIRVNYANQKNNAGGGGGGGGGGPPPMGGGGMGGGGMGGPPPPMGMGGPPPAGFPQAPPRSGPMGGPSGMAAPMTQQAPAQPQQSYGGPPPSYETVYSQSPVQNSTIYVGNMVPYTTQADLIPLFQAFGYIIEIRMQADRGFAFVKLDNHHNATMAIVNLQGTPLHGRALKASWGKDRVGNEGPAPVQLPPQQQAQAGYGYGSPYGAQAGYASPQGAVQQDPAQAAAMAAWQAQYGAQYAAYMQQQAQMAAQGQGQGGQQ